MSGNLKQRCQDLTLKHRDCYESIFVRSFAATVSRFDSGALRLLKEYICLDFSAVVSRFDFEAWRLSRKGPDTVRSLSAGQLDH